MNWVRLPLVLIMGLMLMYDSYCLGDRVRPPSLKFVQSGMASWYGGEQQGRRTASGEMFNRQKFTAASRRLPFNSVVRVTNEKNGRHVDVRINDRGPYTKNRILDLSEAAAKSLDMKDSGAVPVKVEMVQPIPAQSAISP